MDDFARQLRWCAFVRLALLLVCVLLTGCTRQPPAVSVPINFPNVLVDECVGDNRIIVSSMLQPDPECAPALLLSLRQIQVCAGYVRVHNRLKGIVFELSSGGEIGPDYIVDYSRIGSGRFEFTELTETTASAELGAGCWAAPFVRTTVFVRSDGSIELHEQVLLSAEPADSARIAELLNVALGRHKPAIPGAAEEAVTHLRNIGLGQPDAAIAALQQIRSDNSIVSDAIYDIERARKINRR